MQKRVFLKANLRKKTRRHETHISPNDINDTHDCMLVQYMHSSQFLPAVRSSQLSVTRPLARVVEQGMLSPGALDGPKPLEGVGRAVVSTRMEG